MACNEYMTFHKSLLNKRYEEHQTNLNPFVSLLFSNNWNWSPNYTLAPSKLKSTSQKTSIKNQIVNWFKELKPNEKISVTTLNDWSFLEKFLKLYRNHDEKLKYNLPKLKSIQNPFHKKTPAFTETLYANLRISWTTQPTLWINNQQGALNQLLEWLQQVSSGKIFEYAHKISNKNEPEQNLLWFNSLSFHPLENWLANELQKKILKNYFLKNSSNFSRFSDFKKYLQEKGMLKQISLLQDKFQTAKLETYDSQLRQALNKAQQSFIENTHEKMLNNFEEQITKKTKKKNKKKNKKKGSNEDEQKQQQSKNQSYQSKNQSYDLKEPLKKLNEQYGPIQEIQQIKQEIQLIEKQQILIKQSQRKQLFIQSQLDVSIVVLNKPQSPLNKLKVCQSPKNKIKFYEDIDSQVDNSYSDVKANKCKAKKPKKQKYKIKMLEQFQELSSNQNNADFSEDIPQIYKQTKKSSSSPSSKSIQSFTDATLQPVQSQTQYQNYQDLNHKLAKNRKNKTKKKSQGQKKISPHTQLSQKMFKSFFNTHLNNFIDNLSIQTNSIYQSKVIAFERVRYFVKSLYPKSYPPIQSILFGSNAVGLSLPTSDIDIMLVNIPCRCKEEAQQFLAQIAVQINAMGWIVSCSTYLNAKVPIIKLQIDPTIRYLERKRKSQFIYISDPYISYYLEPKQIKSCKNIKVDVTFSIMGENCMGCQSTELMKNWMGQYPVMHRILLALKYILSAKGFNQNFKGGIGSYCLFVMVAAYVRECELKNEEIKDCQGQLFLKVLKFYGQQFENHIKCIKLVDKGTCFLPIQQPTSTSYKVVSHTSSDSSTITTTYHTSMPLQKSSLVIYDPLNGRVMSGSCSQYNNIKSQFRRIHNQILQQKTHLQKEISLSYNVTETNKMLQNKKSMEKWAYKYEQRCGFKIQDIIGGME